MLHTTSCRKRLFLLSELKRVIQKPVVAFTKSQQLVRKLRHIDIGILSGKGLFTPLHKAMRVTPKMVKITLIIKYKIQDWNTTIHLNTREPVHVR